MKMKDGMCLLIVLLTLPAWTTSTPLRTYEATELEQSSDLTIQTEYLKSATGAPVTRLKFWTSSSQPEGVTLTCAGEAVVQDSVSNRDGTTMVVGRFTGTLIWGERLLKASAHGDIFYMILKDGIPHSLHGLGGPRTDIPLELKYQDGFFHLQTFMMAGNSSKAHLFGLTLDTDGVLVTVARDADSEPPLYWAVIDPDDEETEDPEG